jgi:drug/metabolite transporter (DMT)-like permease
LEVVFGLVAALCFSLGTVIEQQVACTASEEEARQAGFLLRLARRPRWLAGIASDALGFVAQGVALAIGRLVVVQPLLSTTVVFALPLGAKLGHRRVVRRELVAALAVTGGLGVFLVVADPKGGREDATTAAWIVSFVVSAGICAALALAARGRTPARRAGLLGAASGILFGLCAALTKGTVERLDEGVLDVLAHWHLYALIAVGYAAMSLSQSSLQSGALGTSVATENSLDPVTSLLLGVFAFDETIHEDPAGLLAALVAFAVMIAGIVSLTISPPGTKRSASVMSASCRSSVAARPRRRTKVRPWANGRATPPAHSAGRTFLRVTRTARSVSIPAFSPGRRRTCRSPEGASIRCSASTGKRPARSRRLARGR